MARIPDDIRTNLAWRFESVLPGTFRRNKQEYAHIEFPILAPLPTNKAATDPLEGSALVGPFIYFVLDGAQNVCYVGKSKEKTVLKRWIRPGIGGPTSHYWSHTNVTAGCVRQIAAGLIKGNGPYELRFLPLPALPGKYAREFLCRFPRMEDLELAEQALISMLRPMWNENGTHR